MVFEMVWMELFVFRYEPEEECCAYCSVLATAVRTQGEPQKLQSPEA
jgi:hypothetical protein